ncbi:MAG: fibrobacter succinogenes major paralogous domain-containing protein [Spirochaetota bacterium]
MKRIILSIGVFMLISTVALAENKKLHTLKDTVEDVEGNTYHTVKIGNQVWLAENLRSTKFQDGSKIKTAFIANDDEKNLLQYGRLYDWHDVSDTRNICPIGWRVASDDDWKQLEKTIGMSEEELDKTGWRGQNDIGITLKESQPDTMFKKFEQTEVNKYNFSVRPAGIKWKYWYFVQGMYAEFWTSSGATEEDAYNRTFAHSSWNWHKGEIYRSSLAKTYMFSVRCVKNEL